MYSKFYIYNIRLTSNTNQYLTLTFTVSMNVRFEGEDRGFSNFRKARNNIPIY